MFGNTGDNFSNLQQPIPVNAVGHTRLKHFYLKTELTISQVENVYATLIRIWINWVRPDY